MPLPDLQTAMRLQNMFGAPDFTVGDSLPNSGPAALSAPPVEQPGQDPFANISFGDTKFQPSTTMPAQMESANNPQDTPFDVTKRMQELYQPHTQAIDKFNQLMGQYPNRANFRPSMMQRIAASLAMFGRGGPDMAMTIMNQPYANAMTDWSNQIKEAGQSANYERYQNTNERTMAYQTVSQELRQRAQDLKDKNDIRNAQIREHRAAVYEFKATHPNLELIYPKGGNVSYLDPSTKQLVDTGIPVGSMTELDKLNLSEKNTLTNIGARGKVAENLQKEKETNKGWSVVDIPDPENPNQKISVRLNADTGQVAPIIYQGKNVSTAQKIGTNKSAYDELTSQTKTMMEGSKMLLPHVNELRNQALMLEKNGMFGPVMSRVRNLAAKLGTTGTPEQIQASLDDFARAITNDPQLSQDAAVGQFTTSLGLMASGMGRVHGGARGGGSIQMINYLKNLLSVDSTYSMFSGRLSSIESYLKGYAAGPQSPATGNLDKALDKLFPPK